MVLDQSKVDELRLVLIDRLTPEELVEALGVSTAMVFDRFAEECMELNLEDVL